jgi:hypothetical protein
MSTPHNLAQYHANNAATVGGPTWKSTHSGSKPGEGGAEGFEASRLALDLRRCGTPLASRAAALLERQEEQLGELAGQLEQALATITARDRELSVLRHLIDAAYQEAHAR